MESDKEITIFLISPFPLGFSATLIRNRFRFKLHLNKKYVRTYYSMHSYSNLQLYSVIIRKPKALLDIIE